MKTTRLVAFRRGWPLAALGVLMLLSPRGVAQTNQVIVSNANWGIIIDDFGYSDVALDFRPGFWGREYLSGEWAAAVTYVRNTATFGPTWLNPAFLYPDWDSNSDFGAEKPVAAGALNAWGFPVYQAVITNASLRIGIRSEMIDTTNGIAIGLAPRSAAAGSNTMSDRYVFRQTYGITNRSGVTLNSVKFFKFIHSLEANTAVYDDRAYAGTFSGYRHTIAQQGFSPGFQGFEAPVLHFDVVAQHGNVPPAAWEVGYYGIDPIDDHVYGKPSVGVHLSVEADALSNLDSFAPAEKWVSGAVGHVIGTLAPNASTNLEFLLTVRTDTRAIPLRIERAASNVILSWPAITGDYFYLYQDTNLFSTNWTMVSEFMEVQGTNNTVTVPVDPGRMFFKLGF